MERRNDASDILLNIFFAAFAGGFAFVFLAFLPATIGHSTPAVESRNYLSLLPFIGSAALSAFISSIFAKQLFKSSSHGAVAGLLTALLFPVFVILYTVMIAPGYPGISVGFGTFLALYLLLLVYASLASAIATPLFGLLIYLIKYPVRRSLSEN
jgi:hypothetical protein